MSPHLNALPFIGRDRELRAVRAAVSGPGTAGGVLIAGAAGVGKTRLAQEAAAYAETRGRQVLAVRSSASGTSLPLGALAGLLPAPGETPAAPGGPVQHGLFGLRRAAARAPTVLLVDDAHLLDEVSATVIHQVVAEQTVTLLATLRTGESVPHTVTALWKDIGVPRIDLDALAAPDADALIVAVLGGPVEGQTSRRLREVAAGNALFLHELLRSVREAGLLTRSSGVWRLTGRPPVTARLTELLSGRLVTTDPAERDALELVAVGEPVPLDAVDRLVDRELLETLERRGLIAVLTADRPTVWCGHPLYGELLREQISPLARLRHTRRLADALEQAGAHRGAEILQVARWRLDAGGVANPDLTLAAAEQAGLIREYALAERLARSAYDNGAGIPAGLLLVRAMLALGRTDEALHRCTILAEQATDDAERAQVAIQHASALAHGGDDLRAGQAVLDSVTVSDPRWREQLDVVRLYLRPYGLDCTGLDAALAAFEAGGEVGTRIAAASAAGAALMLAGRYAEAERLVARTLPLAVGNTGPSRVHTDSMRPAGGWMRCNLLDPIGAWAQTEAAYAESLHPPDRVAQAFSAFTLGLVGLMLGRPVTALRWAGEAYLVAKETGKSALCRWAAAVRLQAAAQRGAEDEVAVAAVDLAHHRGGPHRVLLFEMEVARARAWRAAVRADAAGVRAALGEEIARHGRLGAVGTGALGALDLVRLGEPDLAVRLLTTFPPPRDWVLGRLVVGYATAAAAADAVALFVTAREFAGYDLPLHAAEAATQAALAWRVGGQPHRAARALLLAELQLARCEPAATPALRTAGPFVGLTDREREITLAVVRGESARAIAQRLYLAERTVENHLHRAYRKLAVAGRTELREVLGLD